MNEWKLKGLQWKNLLTVNLIKNHVAHNLYLTAAAIIITVLQIHILLKSVREWESSNGTFKWMCTEKLHILSLFHNKNEKRIKTKTAVLKNFLLQHKWLNRGAKERMRVKWNACILRCCCGQKKKERKVSQSSIGRKNMYKRKTFFKGRHGVDLLGKKNPLCPHEILFMARITMAKVFSLPQYHNKERKPEILKSI